MSQKPETVFRKRVRKDLTALKAKKYPFAFFAIQQKTISGDPDFFLCVDGLFIGLELKDERGVVSALQDHKLTSIAEANGLGIVAKPSNWVHIKEYLESILKGEHNGPTQLHHDQASSGTSTKEASDPKVASEEVK